MQRHLGGERIGHRMFSPARSKRGVDDATGDAAPSGLAEMCHDVDPLQHLARTKGEETGVARADAHTIEAAGLNGRAHVSSPRPSALIAAAALYSPPRAKALTAGAAAADPPRRPRTMRYGTRPSPASAALLSAAPTNPT